MTLEQLAAHWESLARFRSLEEAEAFLTCARQLRAVIQPKAEEPRDWQQESIRAELQEVEQ